VQIFLDKFFFTSFFGRVFGKKSTIIPKSLVQKLVLPAFHQGKLFAFTAAEENSTNIRTQTSLRGMLSARYAIFKRLLRQLPLIRVYFGIHF
jgi:hypothetical protein